jgi:hypothetical protein
VILGEVKSRGNPVASNRVRRIGMKRMVYVLIAVCLLALSACGGAGPPGEPVTKAEDLVGVWCRTERWRKAFPEIYMQFRADGTMGFSTVADKWDYEWMSLECAFEGTRLSVSETAFHFRSEEATDTSCTGRSGAPSGVYEIQLLANGNLKFVNAQDNCEWRREILALAEWEPVQ